VSTGTNIVLQYLDDKEAHGAVQQVTHPLDVMYPGVIQFSTSLGFLHRVLVTWLRETVGEHKLHIKIQVWPPGVPGEIVKWGAGPFSERRQRKMPPDTQVSACLFISPHHRKGVVYFARK
jgi:hypothetical protein